MEFGMRIKMKRKAMGLTCSELAEKVGCSRAYVSMLENGRTPQRHRSGAVARLKSVLKIRVRGASPKKAAGRVRKPLARKPGPATANKALLKAIHNMHLAVSALSTQVARLSAKVSTPSRMMREAPVAPQAPVSEANGTPAPEAQAA